MKGCTKFKDRGVQNPYTKLFEEILASLDVNVTLARRSQASWRVDYGTARIEINYYENGIIIGDSKLCVIPKENIYNDYSQKLNPDYNPNNEPSCPF